MQRRGVHKTHIGAVDVAIILASSSCNPIKTCNLVKSLHFHTICARRGRGLRSKDDIVFWTSLQRRRSLVLSQCARYIFVYHCTAQWWCGAAPHPTQHARYLRYEAQTFLHYISKTLKLLSETFGGARAQIVRKRRATHSNSILMKSIIRKSQALIRVLPSPLFSCIYLKLKTLAHYH